MSTKKHSEDQLFDPRLCSYKLSGDLRNHVERLIQSKDADQYIKEIITELMEEDESNKNTLSYDSLVKLHKYIQRADRDFNDPFYKFCDACKCIKPKPRINRELDERLQNLRFKHSQEFYHGMTSSVDRLVENKVERALEVSNGSIVSDQSTLSEFKNLYGSMIAVFNSFLVIICTFLFCYKALEYSLPQPNIIAQVVLGLLGSTVVAIAELYFLLRVV